MILIIKKYYSNLRAETTFDLGYMAWEGNPVLRTFHGKL